jgi:hydrogenase expression/formation protein HypC
MCLAIPALVKKIDGNTGQVDMGGIEAAISLLLTPRVRVGEYVMVHAGFAIGVIPGDEAVETLRLLNELAADNEM